jgi:hypothetical protein
LATAAGSNSHACASYGSISTFIGCTFEIDNASSGRRGADFSSHNNFYGCVFKTNGTGEACALSGYGGASNCVFIGGSVGFKYLYNGSLGAVTNCTFYNNTTGVEQIHATDKWLLANNLFHGCTTGIAFASTSSYAHVINNSFYNCTTNIATHNSRAPALSTITESSDPLTNAGTDFSLAAGANSLESSYPYIYQLIGQRQYLDVGAVQKESGGGSGGSSNVIVIED